MSDDRMGDILKGCEEYGEYAKNGKAKEYFAKKFGDMEPQEVFVNCSMFSRSLRSEGFPVCKIVSRNTSSSDRIIFCSAKIGDRDVKMKFLAPSGNSSSVIKLKKYVDCDLSGEGCDCSFVIKDQYARRICSEKGFVFFGDVSDDVKISVIPEIKIRDEIEINEVGDAVIADIDLKCIGASSLGCIISYSVNGHRNDIRCDASAKGKSIHLTAMSYMLSGKDECDISVSISSEYSDDVTVKGKARIATPVTPAAPISKNDVVAPKKIIANMKMHDMIDTHSLLNGRIVLGNVCLESMESSKQLAWVTLSMDGTTVVKESVRVSPGSLTVVDLTVAPDMISSEESRDVRFTVTVSDDSFNTVAEFNESVMVRSKFDLDLNKISRRCAEFVNPHCPEIKRLVDDKNGELFKRLNNKCVTGYQDPSSIIDQISAVYDTVRDMGLCYVSDVCTIKSNSSFQRVRGPSAVLRDGSGNCIELSILFASILESMCFEPCIMFTESHTMVGVVIATDAYKTRSCEPEQETQSCTFTRDDGKTVKVIPFESTLCTYAESTFGYAVDAAIKKMNEVSSFCLIKEFRLNKVDPVLM